MIALRVSRQVFLRDSSRRVAELNAPRLKTPAMPLCESCEVPGTLCPNEKFPAFPFRVQQVGEYRFTFRQQVR